MASPDSERMVAAERRGWVFEISPEGVQATRIEVDDDDRGAHFVGDGENALALVLDQVEALDREHQRL